jgi:hypothetical protein
VQEWDHAFDGENAFAVYAESNLLHVQVFDTLGYDIPATGAEGGKKKKKQKPIPDPVLIGTVGIRFDRERLLDFDNYTMNGDPKQHVSVELTVIHPVEIKSGRKGAGRKAATEKVPAGTTNLRLLYVPTPSVLGRAAAKITETWYFEACVLIMVFLSMASLAIKSPSMPPPPTLYGSLRIIELFIAVELVTEMVLEIEVKLGKKELKFWKDPKFMMAGFVLFCNWSSFLISDEDHPAGSHWYEKALSVGRIFRILRPLQTLRMIDHIDMIVAVVAESVTLFLTVTLLLAFLLAIFALVGVSSFAGTLQYECLDVDKDGSVPCPSQLTCSEDYELCARLDEPRVVGADAFGYRNYDNFWQAAVTTFVQTTGDGGVHTMPEAVVRAGGR